jgi:hypothetical protein
MYVIEDAMKRLFLVIPVALIIWAGCSKKDEIKLTAFGTEAFAYGMGDSSEVDATTRVKGFKQDKKNNLYSSAISYYIDLITPVGDTVKSIVSRVVDKSSIERLSDTELDVQFDISPAFIKGKYKLVFNINDALSGASASSTANFDLGN